MRVVRRAVREPVALSAALIGVVNVGSAFGVLHLTNGQLGLVNAALASVLGFLARLLVSPAHRYRAQRQQPVGPRQPAGSE